MKQIRFFWLAIVGLLCSMNVWGQDKTYKVTLKCEPAELNEIPAIDPKNETYSEGQKLVLYAQDEKNGYQFYKWSTTCGTSFILNPFYYNTSATMPGQDITLTAHYAKPLTVNGLNYLITSESSGDQPGTVVLGDNSSCTIQNLVIPDEVTGPNGRYIVEGITGNAFEDCTSLHTLTLGANVKFIENSAFQFCSSLDNVSFEQCTGLEYLGNTAFRECTQLQSVDFSACPQLQSIGKSAFTNCTKLASTNFSNCTRLKTIDKEAFKECKELNNVNFTNCVQLQHIEDGAFYGDENLSANPLPECVNLKKIGNGAFAYTKIAELDLSHHAHLEMVDFGAFEECPELVRVDLSNCEKLREIEVFTWYGCPRLTSVNLSNCPELEFIGDLAFAYSPELLSVNLSNCPKLKYLGGEMFTKCTKLSAVHLNHCTALDTLGADIFKSCGISTIDFSGCTAFQEVGPNVFFKSSLKNIVFPKTLNLLSPLSLHGANVFPSITLLNVNMSNFKDMEMLALPHDQFKIKEGAATDIVDITDIMYEDHQSYTSLVLTRKSGRTTLVDNNGNTTEIAVGGYALDITASGYATFANGAAYVMPAGLKGGVVYVNGNEAVVSYIYGEGEVVPAGQALVIKGTPGAYLLPVAETEATVLGEGNQLKPALAGGTFNAQKDHHIFVFSQPTQGALGFYYQQGQPTGEAASDIFGKGYLELATDKVPANGLRLVEEGEATGIEGLQQHEVPAAIYTLSGVRVEASSDRLPKGLYIVNGKKMFVK